MLSKLAFDDVEGLLIRGFSRSWWYTSAFWGRPLAEIIGWQLTEAALPADWDRECVDPGAVRAEPGADEDSECDVIPASPAVLALLRALMESGGPDGCLLFGLLVPGGGKGVPAGLCAPLLGEQLIRK